MNDGTEKRFRVIVVGGGVTGLTASHVLQKANIEHVVLERGHEAAPHNGASIAIYPHGSRILQQIGCLEAAKSACVPMKNAFNRLPDGSAIVKSKFFDFILQNHGYDVLLLERRAFLEVLYDNLPDKSRILFGKKVKDVVESKDDVEVFLEDGTTEKGDMIIGCDGVHSTIREAMWENANRAVPGLITAAEKRSLTTHWTCLVGMGAASPGMGERDMTCVHDKGYSFLILSQPTKLFFFVFFKLAEPYHWPNRPRYSDLEAENAAAKVADHAVSDTMVFGELWKKRIRGQLVSLEEGIFKHWHFGRTVLAGDAAHKITPNIALGGNTGMESVVVLANLLNREIKSRPNGKPDKSAIEAAFHEYQETREARVKKIFDLSSLITRLQAWDNVVLRLAACFVIPWQRDAKIAEEMGTIIKAAPKLDYVPLAECKKGLVMWDDEKSVTSLKGGDLFSGVRRKQIRLIGVLLAFSSLVWLMLLKG